MQLSRTQRLRVAFAAFRLVDEFSSREIKRLIWLIYVTDRH